MGDFRLQPPPMPLPLNPANVQVHQQLHQLREENGRLLSQLLDLQQGYQDLLRRNLSEQRLHLRALEQGMRQAGQLRGMALRSGGRKNIFFTVVVFSLHFPYTNARVY